MPIHENQTAHTYTPVSIDVRALHWNAVGHLHGGGDPKSKLITTILIGGVQHHLEAIEVFEDDDGTQHGVENLTEFYEDLSQFAEGDGAFETVAIEGRQYCLWMTPFCS